MTETRFIKKLKEADERPVYENWGKNEILRPVSLGVYLMFIFGFAPVYIITSVMVW